MAKQTFSIREYREEDEDAVVALWNDAFPESAIWTDPATDIARKLLIQQDLFLVGEAVGRLVGTVIGGYDGHRGWVYSVAVVPEFRRRGCGHRLMSEVESGSKNTAVRR